MLDVTRKSFFCCLILGVALFPGILSDAAAQSSIDFGGIAEGFSCTEGGDAIGKLFDTGVDQCDPLGIETMFSHFVCTYENIVSEILGKVFCAMKVTLFDEVGAVITLFIVLFGAGLLTGVTPGTARDGFFFLMKFALVFYFASEASLTIGILYTGLMQFIQESVLTVLQILGDQHTSPVNSLSGEQGVLRYMDQIVAEFFRNNAISQEAATPCEKGLVAFIFSLAAAIPSVAMFTVGIVIQLFLSLLRAILGYLIAITGIMFILTLAPIFLSFSLFKITQSYFAKWVQYLISFSVQVFIVFGMVAMVLSLEVAQDLRSMFDLVRPFSTVKMLHGQRNPIEEWCSICEHEVVPGTMRAECTSDQPIDPHSLTMDSEFIELVVITFGKIFLLAYLLDAALKAAPQLARALGAVPYSPTLGSLEQGNIGSVGAGSAAFGRAFKQGTGSTYSRAAGAAGAGWRGLIRGDPATRQPGALQEAFSSLLGLRR